jgi:hypothetical protein
MVAISGLGRSRQGEPCHSRSSQVVERHADNANPSRGVQRGLQRRAYRDNNGNPGLGLLEGDPLAVIGGPGEAKQVTLPLPGPQSELQRKVKVPRYSVEEGEVVIKRPDLVTPRAAIALPADRD